MSGKTFVEILNAIRDDNLIRAPQTAGTSTPFAFAAARGPLNRDTIREFVTILVKRANLFEFNEKYDGDEHGTLVHELGPKWSLFLAHCLSNLLADKVKNALLVQSSISCAFLHSESTDNIS